MSFRQACHSPRIAWVLCLVLVSGCRFVRHKERVLPAPSIAAEATAPCTELDIASPASAAVVSCEHVAAVQPFALGQNWPPPFRDLALEEAVHLAMAHSEVMRDMGGLVLRAPGSLRTVHDPAIQVTDPRYGVEAALSAFDASFAASAFFEKNDRPLNNYIEGLGTNLFQQDLGLYNFELSKRSAVGTELALRNMIDYNFNNSPANSDPNLPWSAQVEGEVRQPLLQGAGAEFNRIAGPFGRPGFNAGVLIARTNSDLSLADFESAVADLVNNVENAYWELYFAYRDLDAKIAARDRAVTTWQAVRALYETGRQGGDAEQEAEAREQYFRMEAEVQNALAGRVVEKSNANVFRGTGGVLFLERRLRRAIGLPANDGHLLRPSTEPPTAKVLFAWCEIVEESLNRRVELRRQKWEIVRSEMELLAARNYLKPRLDAVARYRFRGLGHDLLDPDRAGLPPFDNAYQNLTNGDFQEWGTGVELTVPIGNRLAHTGVRNAELRLSRSRAVLREQEQEVISDLASAVAEVGRAYHLTMSNFNRRAAAIDQLRVLEVLYDEADESDKPRLLNRLLDAQRRLSDADSLFFHAITAYAFAIKQVHFEKGSLLDYNEVYLSEGPWPSKAYKDAENRGRWRKPAPGLTRLVHPDPPVVSGGPHPQQFVPPDTEPIASPPPDLP